MISAGNKAKRILSVNVMEKVNLTLLYFYLFFDNITSFRNFKAAFLLYQK